MHPICQQTLTANFRNSELQRHGINVEGLLADPNTRQFVDWVAKKDPDFTATITKKQRQTPNAEHMTKGMLSVIYGFFFMSGLLITAFDPLSTVIALQGAPQGRKRLEHDRSRNFDPKGRCPDAVWREAHNPRRSGGAQNS